MFCPKCGRYMDYMAPICRECQSSGYTPQPTYATPNSYNPYAQRQPAQRPSRKNLPEDPYNPMYGFGKAITSTILGFVAYVFLMVAILNFSDAGFMFIFATPGAIISLVFSINSITCFGTRRAPCARPVAALVFGIIGLFFAIMDMFMLMSLLFMFFGLM